MARLAIVFQDEGDAVAIGVEGSLPEMNGSWTPAQRAVDAALAALNREGAQTKRLVDVLAEREVKRIAMKIRRPKTNAP